MGWWNDGHDGVLGDGPADAMARVRSAIAKSQVPTCGGLVDALAAAVRREGAELLAEGGERKLLWIRIRRSTVADGERAPAGRSALHEFGREDSAATPELVDGFVAFLRGASKAYRSAHRRKPTWVEVLNTVDFVVGAAPRSYMIDPRGFSLGGAWVGWVDARGAIAPEDTLDALDQTLRARWKELYGEGVTLGRVGMRRSIGDAIAPRGGRAPAALLAEVDSLVRAVLARGRVEPRLLGGLLSRALARRRERFLGGAECESCALDLELSDTRRRVLHPTFGDGVVLREIRDGSATKLSVEFDHHGAKVMLESMVTPIPAAPPVEPTPLAKPTPLSPYAPPFLVAASQPELRAIAVDATHVYWTLADEVRRKAKDGGPVVTLASREDEPTDLVIADGAAFWMAANEIRRTSTESTSRVAATVASSEASLSAIAVHAGRLYVAEETGTVKAIPVEGGDAVALVTGETGIRSLAVEGAEIVWASDEGAVRRAPKDGGAALTIAAGEPPARHLLVDEAQAFWLAGRAQSSSILCAPRRGGEPQVLVAGLSLEGFGADASFLYWTDAVRGRVLRVTKAGGPPEVVVEGLDSPSRLVVDARAGATLIYWTEPEGEDDGRVLGFAVSREAPGSPGST